MNGEQERDDRAGQRHHRHAKLGGGHGERILQKAKNHDYPPGFTMSTRSHRDDPVAGRDPVDERQR